MTDFIPSYSNDENMGTLEMPQTGRMAYGSVVHWTIRTWTEEYIHLRQHVFMYVNDHNADQIYTN